MDVSRAVLENLMGRDRNKCKDNITERDHYSNPDVCKPFLVCFCFNTLFPNTIYDQGPCNKRHDTYLKNMFDNDLHRSDHQKQYIKECIRWIQRRLVDVKQKTNKNQGVIDNKSNFPTDRPKQILDRIMAIDQDIQKMMIQAQMYGQKGQIDDSARCLEEVQRLRDRRKQIQLMGNDLMNAAKQQKICQICGAIQTINDTEKRIQTHLEGKIHQGFLKLRHQIQSLKIRLQILIKMDPHKSKQQRQQHDNQQNNSRDNNNHSRQQTKMSVQHNNNKPSSSSQKEKQKENNAHLHYGQPILKEKKEEYHRRDRSRSHSKKKKKQRSRERRDSRDKQRQRERERDKKNNDYDRDRNRDKQHRDRDRQPRDNKDKDRQYRRQNFQQKYRQKEGRDHHKDKQRQRQKDRDRQRQRQKDRQRQRDHKKKHKKDRSRSRSHEKQKRHSNWG